MSILRKFISSLTSPTKQQSEIFPKASTFDIVTINNNGSWCWFQNERAIICNKKVFIGSVADNSGADGFTRGGDIDLSCWDLESNRISHTILHVGLEADDHDAPAVYMRQDGRLVAIYGKHNCDSLQRWRVSRSADEPMVFEDEQVLDVGAGYTYQNIYRMAAENGRLYNFHRGRGFNPNYSISDDDGITWRYGGQLLQWAVPSPDDRKYSGLDGGRPYIRFAGNGIDQLHFVVSEDHPRAYTNSIYHGFLSNNAIYSSFRKQLAPLIVDGTSALSPTALTPIFHGDENHIAWVSDIRLDSASRPYVAFTVRMNDAAVRNDPSQGGTDIRYHYARFDGSRWHSNEIAYGGTRLYSPEVDYSGLITLHPHNPNLLFISTNADPSTGAPLISRADRKRHHEIFQGVSPDEGRTWNWTAITHNSNLDNLRPIIPIGAVDQTILLWTRGSYITYQDYSMSVVGLALECSV